MKTWILREGCKKKAGCYKWTYEWMDELDESLGGVKYRTPYGGKNDSPGDDGTLRSV